MRRRLVHWVLILLFTWPPQLLRAAEHASGPSASSSARVPALARAVVLSLAIHRKTTLQRVPEGLAKAIDKAYVAKPAAIMSNMGQGFLFILALAGIDLMADEIRKKGWTLDGVTREQLSEAAGTVSHSILNDGAIWSGLAAAGAASGIAAKPADAIVHVFMNARLRPQLAKVLQQSLVMIIGFWGWEFGAQLWREASLMLESPDDYARATSILGMGGAYMRALKFSALREDAETLRVLRLMIKNMLYVLIFNPELREQLVSNTWRHFMTGEVATLLTATMAGSAVGTALLPGGGTLVGAIFGGLGAAVSLFIKQEANDAITAELQAARQVGSRASLALNEGDLKNRILKSRMPEFRSEASKLKAFEKQLMKRRHMRAGFITAGIDRVHLTLKQMKPSEEARSLTAEEAGVVLNDVFEKLVAFHAAEESRLKKMSELASKYATQRHLRDLSEELARVGILKEFLASFGSDLEAELPVLSANLGRTENLPESAEAMVKFIDSSHTRGFDESTIVEKWRALAR